MREKEPQKEIIEKGELYFLCYPEAEGIITGYGYGITMQVGRKDLLVGLLMVDRPKPVEPSWLQEIEITFGNYQLAPMTAKGERGIICQMQVEKDSLPYVCQFPADEKTTAIEKFLKPLLEEPPKPVLILHWNMEAQLWQSRFPTLADLPTEIRDVFAQVDKGCLAAETNIGVVHICHAPDIDIQGFADKPVWYQWQLIKMPTAPLIRLELAIIDQPLNPYKFESFLNVAEADQVRVLNQLANQDELYLVFYGDNLKYRYTKVVAHDAYIRPQLDELIEQATHHWEELPPEQRDFDRAKAEFIRRSL
jgi:hypothetical protein